MEKALEKNKVEHYAEGAGHKEKIAKGTTDVKPQDLTRKVPRNVPRTTEPVAKEFSAGCPSLGHLSWARKKGDED